MSVAALHFDNALVLGDDVRNAALSCAGFQRNALAGNFPAKFFSDRFFCFGALRDVFSKPGSLDRRARPSRDNRQRRCRRIHCDSSSVKRRPTPVSSLDVTAEALNAKRDIERVPSRLKIPPIGIDVLVRIVIGVFTVSRRDLPAPMPAVLDAMRPCAVANP